MQDFFLNSFFNELDIERSGWQSFTNKSTLHWFYNFAKNSPIRSDRNFDENEATHSKYKTHSLYPLIGQL